MTGWRERRRKGGKEDRENEYGRWYVRKREKVRMNKARERRGGRRRNDERNVKREGEEAVAQPSAWRI